MGRPDHRTLLADLEPGDPPPATDDLSAWIVATAPRAVAYATSLLRDREQAEDVVQDCYCRLLARAEVYDLPLDGLKLLLTAISHACINRQTRRRGIASLFGPDGRSPEVADPSAQEPGGNLLASELDEAIGRGLATLPIRHRAAIELKSQGHSLGEIAQILGITPSNAGVLVHRARAALETFLAPYLEDREP